MGGLTSLGVVHTLVSLIAIVSGVVSLVQSREISATSSAGRTYLVTTLITAATGLGIFQHGGFGPPHALSIMTLLALAVGMVAAKTGAFGRASHLVQLVSFSSTILFHAIPGVTESLTRLPPGAPLLPSAEAPQFKILYTIVLVLFVVGLVLQLRRLRAAGWR